jgi:preprotein translocase subunit SecF
LVELFRERKWDLVGLRNLWFAISIVTIIAGAFFLFYNHSRYGHALNLGIDFTGGGQFTYTVQKPLTPQEQTPALAAIRRDVEQLGISAEIQISGSALGPKNQILLRTKTTAKPEAMNQEIRTQGERILKALETRYPGVRLVSTEMVGPVISRELVTNAIAAVVVGLLLVLIWIMIRYDFKFAVCAIVALSHDVLVLIGAFAILHREINSPFVAVLLTVVGYSVHDTVVIFDRIRENLKLRKGATFAETTNISLLETMARSVNTVLTVLFTVFALYFLGGHTLRDFALGLIIGITSGAYSSIFNASQLLVVWKNREERARKPGGAPRPAPVQRRPAPEPQRPQPAPQRTAPTAAAESGEEEAEPSGPERTERAVTAATPSRSKSKSQKKKGRRKRRY